MFRTLSTLVANPLRARALAYLLRRPGESGTARELAQLAGVSEVRAGKELAALARAGIASTRRARGAILYTPNGHPLALPLATLLDEVANPSDKTILNAFSGAPGVSLIVASGILAHDPRGSVDLLVVCRSPKNPKVRRAIRRVEALAALPLRYAILTPAEYAERQQSFDRMVRDTFEFDHRVIVDRSFDLR